MVVPFWLGDAGCELAHAALTSPETNLLGQFAVEVPFQMILAKDQT